MYAKSLEDVFLGVDAKAIDLISKMLKFNYKERITAKEALEHEYFEEIRAQVEEDYQVRNELKRPNMGLLKSLNLSSKRLKEMKI